MTFTDAQNIHFIGIGGIGISALAKWALEQGRQVSGSDLVSNATTDWLVQHGATITIGTHQATNVPAGCDLVVHTVAVHKDNPEYQHAVDHDITIVDYPHALNALFEGMQGIAVAGTHGKSTTTALLAYILVEAKRDPTVIVGTRVRLFDHTNERIGKGADVLVEADEYNQGILLYRPMHAVVLNVDHEHVDVYPTLADTQAAFQTFVSHVQPEGSVTLNADDPSTPLLKQKASAKVLTFGLQTGDLYTRSVEVTPTGLHITVAGLYTGTLHTQVFGDHNVRNILAALCVAYSLGIDFAVAQKAVADFPGTWRRFENRGMWRGATLIDDYAHHPTEVAATLQAARQAFPHRRLVCVFQPHLHSRTKAFASEFAKVLQLADISLVLEVYDVAGRDADQHVSSADIARALGARGHFAKDVPTAVSMVEELVQPNDVILTMGAGNVTDFSAIAQKENPS